MYVVNKHTASGLIEQAFQDIDATKGVMDDTPFVCVTYTCVNMAAATIYARLAEQEQDEVLAGSLRERSEAFRERALATREDLERFSDDDQVQTALVRLLILMEQDDELVKLSGKWRSDELEVGYAPAHNLCQGLLSLKRYQDATYWAQYADMTNPRRIGTVLSVYVDLANPGFQGSRASLQDRVRGNLQCKRSGSKEFFRFDVMQLVLLGDRDALQYFGDDELYRIIMEGKTYQPHSRYFCPPEQRTIMSAEELLTECSRVPLPIGARSHANYWLAIEAISEGRFLDAKRYLNACLEDGFFHFHVYWMSRVFLAHENDWPSWISE
jgi:hypothetical protein